MTSIIYKFKREFMRLIDYKEISGYIEIVSKKLETNLSLKQQEIEKLKEYKSSLFDCFVLGKLR